MGRRDSRSRSPRNNNRGGRGGRGGVGNRENQRGPTGGSNAVPIGNNNSYNAFSNNNNMSNNSNLSMNQDSQQQQMTLQQTVMGMQRNDGRPDVERRKGGVKLFVGRIPQEAPEQLIRKTFERFGQVLEVFKMRGEKPGEERHSLYHEDGLTCAFVRMRDVPSAEDAIARLHDQEILLKNRRDTGPIQVAYAKGEAVRLGLESTREALPNRLEGKEIVRQLKERMILEAPDKQSFRFKDNGNPFWFPTEPLIQIVQAGRKRDRMFENCWRHYCSEGWGGTYEIEPELMPHHGIVQFVMMRTVDYGDAEWFLNMVKQTHNKLKTGELQSSQRRQLTLEEVHAKKVTLSRPGDPQKSRGGLNDGRDGDDDEDKFDVVERHAEIMRNKSQFKEVQNLQAQSFTIAPGQGGPGLAPPPGQVQVPPGQVPPVPGLAPPPGPSGPQQVFLQGQAPGGGPSNGAVLGGPNAMNNRGSGPSINMNGPNTPGQVPSQTITPGGTVGAPVTTGPGGPIGGPATVNLGAPPPSGPPPSGAPVTTGTMATQSISGPPGGVTGVPPTVPLSGPPGPQGPQSIIPPQNQNLQNPIQNQNQNLPQTGGTSLTTTAQPKAVPGSTGAPNSILEDDAAVAAAREEVDYSDI